MAISHLTLAMSIAIWLHGPESEDRFPHTSGCSSYALQRCLPSRTFAFGRFGGTTSLQMILFSGCSGGEAARATGKGRLLGRRCRPKPHRAKVLPSIAGHSHPLPLDDLRNCLKRVLWRDAVAPNVARFLSRIALAG